MNETKAPSDPEDYLRQLNDQTVTQLLPATIYVAALMVLGSFGNAAVLYFYWRKTRRTVNNTSISFLACCDLFICCLAMPSEIVDLTLPFMFENSPTCKLFEFITNFSCMLSGCMLLIIAADRYLKVCKPLGFQMELCHFKVTCLISGFLSTLLSWPSVLLYGIEKINITHSSGEESLGYDCTFTSDKSFETYVWIFNMLQIVAFVLTTFCLFVVYFLIGRAVLKHKRFTNTHTRKFIISAIASYRFTSSVISKMSRLSRTSEKSITMSSSRCSAAQSKETDIEEVGQVALEQNQTVQSPDLTENSNHIDKVLVKETKENDQGDLSDEEISSKYILNNSSTCKKEIKATEDIERRNSLSRSAEEFDPNSCVEKTKDNQTFVESNRKTNFSVDNDSYTIQNKILEQDHFVSHDRSTSIYSISNASIPSKRTKDMPLRPHVHSYKHTFMMFLIAVVYIISFLPYFGVALWRNIDRDRDTELSNGIQIALRSYLFNSAVNPVIYGLFNPNFGKFLKHLIYCTRETGSINQV